MNFRYVLECTDCPFRTTLNGEFGEVFDVVEPHWDEHSAGPTEHFVNVHRVNGSEQK